MELSLHSKEIHIFISILFQLTFEFFYFRMFPVNNNPPHKLLNFRLLKHIRHNKIKQILIFKQHPILTCINSPQPIYLRIEPHHKLHKNTGLIHNRLQLLYISFIQRNTEYLIHSFQEPPIKMFLKHSTPF